MRSRHFLASVGAALANDGAADPPKKQTPKKVERANAEKRPPHLNPTFH